MIFIAGVSPKIKSLDRSSGVCPACGKAVDFYVNKKYSVITFFFIPTIPFGASYFINCPNCESVMALSKNKGKEIEQGYTTVINNGDIEIMQNNAGPTCAACGAKIIFNQNFCYHCGVRF